MASLYLHGSTLPVPMHFSINKCRIKDMHPTPQTPIGSAKHWATGQHGRQQARGKNLPANAVLHSGTQLQSAPKIRRKEALVCAAPPQVLALTSLQLSEFMLSSQVQNHCSCLCHGGIAGVSCITMLWKCPTASPLRFQPLPEICLSIKQDRRQYQRAMLYVSQIACQCFVEVHQCV